jgi:hypothetical protein
MLQVSHVPRTLHGPRTSLLGRRTSPRAYTHRSDALRTSHPKQHSMGDPIRGSPVGSTPATRRASSRGRRNTIYVQAARTLDPQATTRAVPAPRQSRPAGQHGTPRRRVRRALPMANVPPADHDGLTLATKQEVTGCARFGHPQRVRAHRCLAPPDGSPSRLWSVDDAHRGSTFTDGHLEE